RSLVRETVPDSPLDGQSVIIDVRAIGVNYPDLLITQGRYQLRPDLPFVPGCEVAGVVRWTPAGSRWQVGDRVAAFTWRDGFAEQVAVADDRLVAVPEAIGLDTAAALMMNYHTVHFGLMRRGGLTAGETVLVLGAAGGIGTAAIQIARAVGAS